MKIKNRMVKRIQCYGHEYTHHIRNMKKADQLVVQCPNVELAKLAQLTFCSKADHWFGVPNYTCRIDGKSVILTRIG